MCKHGCLCRSRMSHKDAKQEEIGMTENQRRAHEFLQQWYETRIKLNRLEREEEQLRTDAEGVRSTQSIDTGWTGRMISGKRGKKEKEMKPIPKGKPEAGNSKQERSHCLLADKSAECDLQFDLCNRIYWKVVNTVKNLVQDELGRTILILREISGLSYDKIGKAINYSDGHTRKLYYAYLEDLGEKLSKRSKDI